MLGWFQRRAEFRERIARKANELMARHGEYAYDIARDYRLQALDFGQREEHGFWSQVCRIIADQTRREVGPDTATRYLESLPREFDARVDGEEVRTASKPSAVAEPPSVDGAQSSAARLAGLTQLIFPVSPCARRVRGRPRSACGLPGRRPGLGSGSPR